MKRRDADNTDECPHCRRSIYDDAEQCPYCGEYISLEDAPSRRPLWIIVCTVLCLIAMWWWVARF
jgi:predicted nucleic acid-binding Zn ribbon protein